MKKGLLFLLIPTLLFTVGCSGTPNDSLEGTSSSQENTSSESQSISSDEISSSSISDNVSSEDKVSSESIESNVSSSYSSTSIEDKDTLSVIKLTTETGKDVTSKTEYIGGTFESYNADGSKAISKTEMEIRGRGNTTWTFEKKAYRLKFGSKVNPFNIGSSKEKKWILLANMCDHSVIRNQVALNFAENLDNIDFTPNFKPCEIYLNNEYRGTYLLTEAIEVSSSRVDIETGSDEDTGYLIELSKNQADADAVMINDKNGNPYEIKSDNVKSKHKTFIKNYLDDCIDALATKNENTISSLIDIPSAVDTYILQETLNNMDVGWDSFYFTKDKGGKLKFGPVWDFDVSMGNGDDGSQFSEGFHACNTGFERQNDWFASLMDCEWFRKDVQARWSELDSLLENVKNSVYTYSNEQKTANERNFALWSKLDGDKLKKINCENDNVLSLTTYEEQIDYLYNWLDKRIDWLDTNIKSDDFIKGELIKV